MPDTYHHGNLRPQVLATAAREIARRGPDTLSMRELARLAGVTHGAPAHHFGSRRGLFSALAAEGFQLLADALEPSLARRDFAETAQAYVRFAIEHPGHYAVMFRTDLLEDDERLAEQQARAYAALTRGLATVPAARIRIPEPSARQASWSIVHGIAALALAGALGSIDPVELARDAARQLYG